MVSTPRSRSVAPPQLAQLCHAQSARVGEQPESEQRVVVDRAEELGELVGGRDATAGWAPVFSQRSCGVLDAPCVVGDEFLTRLLGELLRLLDTCLGLNTIPDFEVNVRERS